MNAFIGTLFNRSEWMTRADKFQNSRSFYGIELNPTGEKYDYEKRKERNKMNNDRILCLFLEEGKGWSRVMCYICYKAGSYDAMHIDDHEISRIDENECWGNENSIWNKLKNNLKDPEISLTPKQENLILQIICEKYKIKYSCQLSKYKDMQGPTLLRHLSKDYGHYRFLRPYQSAGDAVASTVSPLFCFCFQVMNAFIRAACAAVMLLVSATLAVRGFVTGDYSGAKKAWESSLTPAARSLLFTLDAVDDFLAGVVAPIPRACATLASAFN